MPISWRGDYRKHKEFAKSKGWIKDYYILSNINKRRGRTRPLPGHDLRPCADAGGRQIAREKEMNAYLQSDDRQQMAGSGQRATYRHLGGRHAAPGTGHRPQ